MDCILNWGAELLITRGAGGVISYNNLSGLNAAVFVRFIKESSSETNTFLCVAFLSLLQTVLTAIAYTVCVEESFMRDRFQLIMPAFILLLQLTI